MEKKLLIDTIPFEISQDIIMESIKTCGPLVVAGVLQRIGVKNQNGRIYPEHVLKREAQKYAENFVKDRRAVGELDHPESQIVNLKNVSHNIIEMHWEGDNLVGKVEILTTPSGNILRELLRCGVKLGISSRGLGSVKELAENTVEVQDDFELICFDMVSNPSTKGAFMYPTGNINESSNAVIVNNKWVKVENIVRDVLTELNSQ